MSTHFLLQEARRLGVVSWIVFEVGDVRRVLGRVLGLTGGKGRTNRVYMSDTMSISASACASFCSEESWGWRLKRKDILSWGVYGLVGLGWGGGGLPGIGLRS